MSETTLLELTTATSVSETNDYIPIVDTSDTTETNDGTTKKATVRKLLQDKALPGGDIVGTSDTQTLTGKTLTSPKINEDVALTATSTELNKLNGLATTKTELGYLNGKTLGGSDSKLLTGTPGPGYDDGVWNNDGDLVGLKSLVGTGNGTTDDTSALNAYLTAMSGKVAKIPAGNYKITGTISIPANTTVYAYGARIFDTTTARTLVTMASGSKLYGLEVEGSGNGTYDTNGHAIHLPGDTGSEIENVIIKDCYIHSVSEYGIMCESSKNINISDCRITDIGYAGVMVLSGENINIDNCHIKSITPGTSSNCYGVAFTNWNDYPRSQYCSITNCLIEDVTIWEGIDTHGGKAIRIQNNVIKGCSRGIVLKMAPSSGTAVYAATDCIVDGNIVYGGGNLGCYANGTSDLYAKNNTIANNVFYECGAEGGDYLAQGSVYLGYTENSVISNNIITNSYASGIVLRRNNKGVVVTGNMITDVQNTTGNNAVGITAYLSSSGIITGNQMYLNNASLNDVVGETGIYVGSDSGNSIIVGPNQNTFTTKANIFEGVTDHGVRMSNRTIADDGVYSFTPSASNGFLLIGSATNSGYYGVITYRTGATNWCTLALGNSAMAVATGALTGTTGTDAKLTVSTHTDGKIYIENRLGGSKSIYWITFGV